MKFIQRLKTIFKTEKDINIETYALEVVILPVDVKEKCMYTVPAALKYMSVTPYTSSLFENMILHNQAMRDLLREKGAEQLINELQQLYPVSDDLKDSMNKFVNKWKDKQIADFDIQVMPKDSKIWINKQTILGVKGLAQLVEKSMSRYSHSGPYTVQPKDSSNLHVGEFWESYPVFDSSDRLAGGAYRNFILRTEPITDQELKELAEIRGVTNNK